MRLAPCCILALLAGCPDRTISKVTTDQNGQIQKDIPVNTNIDLLFVIDNSNSTADKQTLFAQNFPRFITALDAFPTGRPNLHIGVVSTSVDDGAAPIASNCPHPMPLENGLLQNTPRVGGCSGPTDRYIVDYKDPSGTHTNYAPGVTLDTEFSCIAQLGTSGCGFEAPLEAMKRALDGTRPENAGFLRKDAFLGVIILTDEDDCSVKDPSIFALDAAHAGPGDFRCQPLAAYQCDTPISPTMPGTYTNCRVKSDGYLEPTGTYFQFLSTLKPPGRSIVALIGGDPATTIKTGSITTPFMQDLALQPSCPMPLGASTLIGRPANRINDFVSRFGDHGLFHSVCDTDYSQALADIGTLLFDAVSPCLEGALDLTDQDPDNPGTQLDCTVSNIDNPDTTMEVETPLPTCTMTDPTTPAPGPDTCWWIKSNPAACSTTTGMELHFSPHQPTTGSIRVRCATKP